MDAWHHPEAPSPLFLVLFLLLVEFGGDIHHQVRVSIIAAFGAYIAISLISSRRARAHGKYGIILSGGSKMMPGVTPFRPITPLIGSMVMPWLPPSLPTA